nr:MAG TPA: hypothetical protein [Caudoviricetes sp.]
MELDLWQLNNLVKAAAKEAVEQFRILQNPTSDEINESQAFREFGEAWVKHQRAIGALEAPIRKGVSKNSPKIYSRKRLTELKYGVSPLIQSVVK